MSNRHKTFVTHHHDNDQHHKNRFVNRFHPTHYVDHSVDIGDIDENLATDTIRRIIRDEYLRDATVTVVLCGTETKNRKHVDWEISATLRDTALNPRGGLIGILLPSHPDYGKRTFNANNLPARLADNTANGYATIHDWTDDGATVQEWIHAAFLRRNQITPDNSRVMFGRNH